MEDLTIKNVDVFGDSIMAVKEKDGNIWAGVSYFCRALGMNKGQKDRQTTNVQRDETLKIGCRKFAAGVFDPTNEAVGMRIDFVPLWLAKINITKTMLQEHPDLADKLLQYQLKAKDILAEAFLPKYAKKDSVDHKVKQDVPIGELARFSTVMERIMVRQNSKPHDIARSFEMLCSQFGITLPDDFVNIPECEQMSLDLKAGE